MLNQNLLLADGGYNLTKSLRFRSSASAYMNRTPASATNRKTWTWSGWVKRGSLSASSTFFFAGNTTGAGDYNGIRFRADDVLALEGYAASCARTTAVFRDPSAWYHIVFALDTTQATATDRLKIYVNGVNYSYTQYAEFPAQNGQLAIDNSVPHNIGRAVDGAGYFDGYLAEVNFIDGQALTPSSFGSTNALTGVWQPAKYNGTYGTNGFYLPFTNTTSTSTLGNDFSGNSNTWTVNNISLTSGSTYDSMTDVPTLTSPTAANYCVWNAIGAGNSTAGISGGNLNTSFSGAKTIDATIGVSSGKWYYELTVGAIGSGTEVGVGFGLSWAVDYLSSGNKNVNGTSSAYGASYTTGDVIGVAFDLDSSTATFYKNGTSQGQITGITYYAVNFPTMYGTTSSSHSVNFGQRPFAYTPPTGFVALNTFNLPTSTIVKGNTVMDATLYTGNGSTQTLTNTAGFKPDLVWVKSRSAATDHKLTDSVRGVQKALISDTTGAETTDTNGLTAFNSNGWSLGTDTVYNNNTATYVGWQWQAGQGSTSSNTNGSITSTVSVNASAGFSVVTYTGNNTAGATVGHGLGVAPKMIIVKSRNTAATDWQTYHTSLGATKSIQLDSTGAAITLTGFWNDTAPTSSVLSLGGASASGSGDTNGSGRTYVAYCWAEIAGFSKFGSYTGNGSTDGSFIYTGFRPKFVLIKRTDVADDWVTYDTIRSSNNVISNQLSPNATYADTSGGSYNDILSNGFKLRETNTGRNANGGTYIYMAFAENPFKNSLAR